MKETTIAAISTAQGSGGIGIVRLSGPQAVDIAEQMFTSYGGKKVAQLEGYTAMLGEIIRQGTSIDQAIVTRFVAPRSYTGEDVVEISCHGGSWVLSQVLRFAFELGAEAAQPGEFTKRAFLNGKMDLLQAESVMDIIQAQGNASLKAANQLREGKVSQRIEDITEMIINQSAHLAAWADYPEEEMEMVDVGTLEEVLCQAIDKVKNLIDTYDYGQILRGGVATAIVGKPNVGKSTLMNLLSGYELSIVSDIPGTTRDVVRESIRLGNLTLQLSDTAGIRDTEDAIEQVGVARAKSQMEGAQLVLALFDGSQPLDREDDLLMEMLDPIQTIVLINKGDLPTAANTAVLGGKFPYILEISAKKEQGVESLEKLIQQVLDLDRFNQGDVAVISNERQRQSLLTAQKALEEGRDALQLGITLDAVGVCLDSALEALYVLSGRSVQEEVVSEVFAQFCVGK